MLACQIYSIGIIARLSLMIKENSAGEVYIRDLTWAPIINADGTFSLNCIKL